MISWKEARPILLFLLLMFVSLLVATGYKYQLPFDLTRLPWQRGATILPTPSPMITPARPAPRPFVNPVGQLSKDVPNPFEPIQPPVLSGQFDQGQAEQNWPGESGVVYPTEYPSQTNL